MKQETWYKLIAFCQALKEVRTALRSENRTDIISELDADLDDPLPLKISDLLLLGHKCPCAAGCMDSFSCANECEFTNAEIESEAVKTFKSTTERLIKQAKEV